MFQLLLVDDERSIVETLAETIPWTECGIATVHEALSGPMALQILEEHAIDIVITDIRMPGMTGIELIKAIAVKWPHIKTILLTGYADFDYAKQAIMSNSFDYLLKPVSDDDLIDSVKRVVHRLQERWAEVASNRQTLHTLNENLPLLRSKTLNELLRGKHYSREALSDKLRMLKLPFAVGDEAGMMLIRMEEHFAELPGQDSALIEYAICNIATEMMQGDYHIWHARDAHDYIVLFVKLKDDSEAGVRPSGDARSMLERYAAQLQTNVELYIRGAVSIMMGGWGTFPDQTQQLYDRAVTAMRRKMGHGKGLFVTSQESSDSGAYQTVWSLYEPPTLHSLLEAGRFDAVGGKIHQIFRDMIETDEEEDVDVSEQLIEAYHVLAGAFSFIIHKNGKSLASVLSQDLEKFFHAPGYTTAAQLKDWSLRILRAIQADVEQELKDNHSLIVRTVRSFVDHHLAKDVSLPAIAEQVHLHPVYLSKIYKAETGEPLTEYVYRLRMEKAAFLLRTTALKVREIAELVGYNNTAYFIRVFKKFFEMTPQEYRDHAGE